MKSRQEGNGRLPWVGERPTRTLVPIEGLDTDINNQPSHMHLPRLARVRTLYSRGMAAEQGRGGKPQSEVRRSVRAHPRRRTLTLLKQDVTVMPVNHCGRIDATSSVSKFVGQTCGLRVRIRWPAGGSCSWDRGEALSKVQPSDGCRVRHGERGKYRVREDGPERGVRDTVMKGPS